jgi:hypothetical protein
MDHIFLQSLASSLRSLSAERQALANASNPMGKKAWSTSAELLAFEQYLDSADRARRLAKSLL